MTLIRTVPPASYPVSLVEVKSHLNITHADHDAKLDQLIATATQHYDGADGVLGRCILPQTWELWLDNFGCTSSRRPADVYPDDYYSVWGHTGLGLGLWSRIEIPLPPLISLDSIEYVDQTDAFVLLDPATYQIIQGGTMPAHVAPLAGTAWPVTKWQPDAVKITFTAGYPVGHVPETIKQAIMLLISYWNENREAWSSSSLYEVPMGAADLVAPLRRIPV